MQSKNPVVMLALQMRREGIKRSEIDWQRLRDQYDYVREHAHEMAGRITLDENGAATIQRVH